jgi:alpha-L-rhamnosidase
MLSFTRISLGLALAVSLFSYTAQAKLSVSRLSCELAQNPVGIDAPRPRLSWILESRERAQTQTAYQILAATSENALKPGKADLWDSGKVSSDETVQIPYAGRTLRSAERCFWKVRLWDQDGKASGWSDPGRWEMGLLSEKDWEAKWIGRTTNTNSQPAPLLRQAFAVKKDVRSARAYVCGLGYYELHLNGKKVGDRLLDPGFTRYDKRVLYSTYDVTDALNAGTNVLGAILGNGWYNVHTLAVWDFHKAPWRAAPKLLLQLNIEYKDGSHEVIATDDTWRTSTGPVVFDSIYSGETYDARECKPGWDTAGYDDSKWEQAALVDAPKGKLRAEAMPPIRAASVAGSKAPRSSAYFEAKKITEPTPGVFVCDFGQNMAGFAELSSQFVVRILGSLTHGAANPATITLKYGERLDDKGSLDRSDIQKHVLKLDTNQTFQTDTYVLDSHLATPTGDYLEIPRFSYNGFQYVEISGLPFKPERQDVRAVFIHSDIESAGEFECSNQMFNKIWRATRWSYLSNLEGIPTDCPHREKNGWTGDAHLAAEQALFNYAPEAVYEKWIADLADEQRPTGELPGIVPTSGWGYKWGNGPAWDSAFVLIPFYLYQYSGDERVLTRNYEGLKRYVDYLTSKAKDGIVSIGLNDWAPYETKTPADITSTAYYYRDAQIVALTAKLLAAKSSGPRVSSPSELADETAIRKLREDARRYSALAASIKTAFNAKFLNSTNSLYGNGSQTALSCALYQGLVPAGEEQDVLSNLVAAVEKRNGHIDTGILGAKYLLNALLENDRADVAYRIADQRDLPSWGWWLDQGATTLWEQWNGAESRNHIMFGDISAWFYKALAGIQPPTGNELLNADEPDTFTLHLARVSAKTTPVTVSRQSLTPVAFKEFTIKPSVVGDLTSASARYDSARGRIVSSWHLTNHIFKLHVAIPPNTSALVSLPTSTREHITENEHPATESEGVSFARTENGATVLKVGSGEYSFSCPVR